MRTTDYPYHHQHIFDHWAEFRYNAQFDQERCPPSIDPLVFDSWRRCKQIFNHSDVKSTWSGSHHDLHTVLARHSGLISTALPYLEDIYQFSRGGDSAVFLTDREGIVLAIQGDLTAINTIHKIGLGIGERWGEPYMGTNAVGLSLITAMPTQVVGSEHYLQIFHDFGDSAAPIHNEQGAIIGTLGFITYADRTNQTQLALVMATARAITAQLQADLILEQSNQRLRKLDHILRSVADGVITWNNDGSIDHVNTIACQILGVSASTLLGKPINHAIAFSEHIQQVIQHQRELSDVETSMQIADRIVKCLVNIRAIHDGTGEVMGGIAMLRRLSQVRSLVNQQTSSTAALTFSDFEYESSQMYSILRQAKIAAKGSSPVLLTGEGGVGKTALAQTIHKASPRMTKPLVVVNCSMIPSEFMVEELLGIEAHGSEQGRPSKFELADGSTLLFDQIDQLSLEAQKILLHVLNSRTVTRLHAQRTTHVNVRIIATTALNIDQLVEMHGFLPQLYYLFNVFHLHIPPLRERREDIVRLTERFLERAGEDERRYQIEDSVLDILQRYPWPGNVRELESVIERAVMNAADDTIRIIDIPENVRTGHSLKPDSGIPQQVFSLVEAEREAIIRAGWAYCGVLSEMAEALGINRSTLWRKLKQHRMYADDFKTGFSHSSPKRRKMR